MKCLLKSKGRRVSKCLKPSRILGDSPPTFIGYHGYDTLRSSDTIRKIRGEVVFSVLDRSREVRHKAEFGIKMAIDYVPKKLLTTSAETAQRHHRRDSELPGISEDFEYRDRRTFR